MHILTLVIFFLFILYFSTKNIYFVLCKLQIIILINKSYLFFINNLENFIPKLEKNNTQITPRINGKNTIV